MKEAVIVSAVRTAVGKAPKGTLKNTRPDDLGAAAIKEAVSRAGVDASLIDDVIMGCAFPEAEQGMNVARTAMIAAGWEPSPRARITYAPEALVAVQKRWTCADAARVPANSKKTPSAGGRAVEKRMLLRE